MTAIVVGVAGLVVLAAGAADVARTRTARPATTPAGVIRDRRLYRLAVLYAASLGLSIVVGNWVVTLLHRHGGLSKSTAGLVGALTLVLGVATRPLGGWILHERPRWMRAAVAGSLVAGALGTVALAVSKPVGLAVVGAALIGLAAGIPFAPAFTGAALDAAGRPGRRGRLRQRRRRVRDPRRDAARRARRSRSPGDGRLGFAVLAGAGWIALARAAEPRPSSGFDPLLQRADRVQDDLGGERGVGRARRPRAAMWLMPSLQGTKTIALGHPRRRRTSCRARRPEGMSMNGSPRLLAAVSSAPTMPRVHRRRRQRLALRELGRHPARVGRLAREGGDVARDAAERVLVDAAHVEREARAARGRR